MREDKRGPRGKENYLYTLRRTTGVCWTPTGRQSRRKSPLPLQPRSNGRSDRGLSCEGNTVKDVTTSDYRNSEGQQKLQHTPGPSANRPQHQQHGGHMTTGTTRTEPPFPVSETLLAEHSAIRRAVSRRVPKSGNKLSPMRRQKGRHARSVNHW